MARLVVVLASVALTVVPRVAWACPACADPRAPNQNAFLTGTIMLSLLPLAMFLALALYVRHRLRTAAHTDAPATFTSPAPATRAPVPEAEPSHTRQLA
jgi:hypothetical protein